GRRTGRIAPCDLVSLPDRDGLGIELHGGGGGGANDDPRYSNDQTRHDVLPADEFVWANQAEWTQSSAISPGCEALWRVDNECQTCEKAPRGGARRTPEVQR